MEYKIKKAVMEVDEQGTNMLTQKYLKLLAREQGYYETPSLNTKLHLHYKGISEIRALDAFHNLAALWLNCNAINRIQNLDRLVNLKHLYLNKNQIVKIENLNTLVSLAFLNLAQNRIVQVENLEMLVCLQDLNLSNNQIKTHENLRRVQHNRTLQHLDLSDNQLNFQEGLFETLYPLQQLRWLYLRNNPAVSEIRNYSKRLICSFPELRYLDNRPIPEIDRISAKGWQSGGREQELSVRREYILKREESDRNSAKYFRKMAKQAQRTREEYTKRISEERKTELEQIEEEREFLLSQRDHDQAALNLLESRSQALLTPINTNLVIESSLKHPVVYREGLYDPYGQPMVNMEELETLLLDNLFDFACVSSILEQRHKTKFTAKFLREVWTEKEENECN